MLNAQLVPSWDSSNRAQFRSSWVDDSSGLSITIEGGFDGSCVDPSLSSWNADYGDGQPIIRIQPRRQTCVIDTPAVDRWLRPHARLTGVAGIRPWITFESFSNPGGVDGKNHQSWITSQRAVYSYDGIVWLPFSAPTITSNELRFRPPAAFDQDVVYVSGSWPRPVTRVGIQIEEIAAAHPDKVHPAPSAVVFDPTNTTSFPAQSFICGELSAKTNELGQSVPAVPFYGFELNDTNHSGPKKLGLITGGIHSGEDVGELWLWEMVDFFLNGTNPTAQSLRQHMRILVYPLCNPSGRYSGYWRGAPGSTADPNREFYSISPTHDCVSMTRAIAESDVGAERVWWVFDFHSTRSGVRAQVGIHNVNAGQVEWDRLARARYPAGDWGYYEPPSTAPNPTAGTVRAWQARTFSPVAGALLESCDRLGMTTPAVMRPYAEAALGSLVDMNAAGWFPVRKGLRNPLMLMPW